MFNNANISKLQNHRMINIKTVTFHITVQHVSA